MITVNLIRETIFDEKRIDDATPETGTNIASAIDYLERRRYSTTLTIFGGPSEIPKTTYPDIRESLKSLTREEAKVTTALLKFNPSDQSAKIKVILRQ